MKITTVSYRHTAKRTENYQSVESSVELTARVDENELASDVLATLKKHAQRAVQADFAAKTAPLPATAGEATVSTPATTPAPAPAAPVPAATTPQNTAGRWGVAARYPVMQATQAGGK